MNSLDAPTHHPPPRGWPTGVALLVAVLASCLVSTPTLAQGVDDPAYRISAGDNLRIEVTGRPDLSVAVAVDDRGEIMLPVLGSVRAGGRTPSELATDLARRVSLVQRETPLVRVIVIESRSQKVFILGSVLMPDAYSLRPNTTVWEAIAEAGGATQDADLSAVEIISAGGEPSRTPVIVDVAAAIQSNAYDTLPRLTPGDTVRVPSKGDGLVVGEGTLVYIMGAVGAQGAHPLEPPGDLISTIIRSSPSAGADLQRVQIVRRSGERLVQMEVNARDYLSDARAAGNPVLRPGDTIYVPSAKRFGLLSFIGTVSPILGFATSVIFLISR